MKKFSPRSKGFKPHTGFPRPGDKPPEHLALKVSRAYFWESQRVWEIETPLLKGKCKISDAPGPRAEAVSLKKPESDSLVDPGEPPGQAGGNCNSHWGHKFWQQSSFYHKDMEASKHNVGTLPLIHYCQDRSHLPAA